MKKKFLTITLIIVAFIIAIQSCKKDEDKIILQSNNNNNNNSQISFRTTADSLTQVKIFNFIERMILVREDPEYEGSEDWNYSLDSTIWYVEAALNYVLTYNYRYYSEEEEAFSSIVDSTNTEIENTGDEYNIVEIQETYDYFLDYLEDYYDEIDDDDKFFHLIDIIGIEDDDINARFAFGVIQTAYPFGNWYWGWALGRCPVGYQGLDAADVLSSYANASYPSYSSITAQFSYYCNVSTSILIYPGNVSVSAHAYGDKMLFEDYQEVTLNHHCLDATEMGVFLDFLPDIATIYQPSGVGPLHYDVKDDFVPGLTMPNQDDFWYMVHRVVITYGIHRDNVSSFSTPPGY